MCSSDLAQYQFTSDLAAGTYYWHARMKDPVIGTGGWSNSRSFRVDRQAPTITSISPNSGANTGSLNLVIFGTNFLNGMTVKLTRSGSADVAATNVQAISATQLTCTFNLGGATAGQWTVVVTHHPNDGGQSGTLANGFTVTGGTVLITSISPNSGANTASVNVTIIGTNFVSGMTVKLTKPSNSDIFATSVQLIGSTQLTCTFNLSGAALGPWTVWVMYSSQSASIGSAFTVTQNAPTISSVSPNSGRNAGSVDLTINGTNYLNGMTAKLTKAGSSDIVGTNVQAINSYRLTCAFNLTGAAPGQWTVWVTHHPNDGGQSAMLANAFTVTQ